MRNKRRPSLAIIARRQRQTESRTHDRSLHEAGFERKPQAGRSRVERLFGSGEKWPLRGTGAGGELPPQHPGNRPNSAPGGSVLPLLVIYLLANPNEALTGSMFKLTLSDSATSLEFQGYVVVLVIALALMWGQFRR